MREVPPGNSTVNHVTNPVIVARPKHLKQNKLCRQTVEAD